MPSHDAAILNTGAARSGVSTRTAVRVACGIGLMALGAQVRFPVPGTEVPATLQSQAMLLVAFTLRPGEALAVMVGYLGLGVCGWPVFAAGSAGLAGPTGGYLLGFLLAAPLISWMSVRTKGVFGLACAGAVGFTVLFAVGVIWRWAYWSQAGGVPVGLAGMAATGFLPFAPKAAVEILLAGMLVRAVRCSRRGA